MEPYQDSDGQWYIKLEMAGETPMGVCGPYKEKQQALDKWDEYVNWCIAMDAN